MSPPWSRLSQSTTPSKVASLSPSDHCCVVPQYPQYNDWHPQGSQIRTAWIKEWALFKAVHSVFCTLRYFFLKPAPNLPSYNTRPLVLLWILDPWKLKYDINSRLFAGLVTLSISEFKFWAFLCPREKSLCLFVHLWSSSGEWSQRTLIRVRGRNLNRQTRKPSWTAHPPSKDFL